MSDLDEAKRLLEKIADANETGSTDAPNVTLALEILLKDYIQRASWAQEDLEKLTSKALPDDAVNNLSDERRDAEDTTPE